MPEQVRCPSCDATLRVPDNLLGKNVKCPKCQETFIAEMEEPEEPKGIVREPRPSSVRRRPPPPEEIEEDDLEEAPEEEYEERPRRRRRGGGRRRAAEAAVVAPATALIVLGIVDLVMVSVVALLRLLGVGFLAAAAAQKGGPDVAAGGAYVVGNIVGTLVAYCFATAILMGGLKMKRLENFGSVVTAAILALLPCGNCCLIGLPLGIWALVVLFRPEVKESFR